MRAIYVLVLVAVVVLVVEYGAAQSGGKAPLPLPTRSKLAPLPKPPPPPTRPRLLGNTTRKVQLKDPAGQPLEVTLTFDRALDARLLDYLAKTLTVIDSKLPAADHTAWMRAAGIEDAMERLAKVGLSIDDVPELGLYLEQR